MNWDKLQQDYPNVYPLLKEYAETHEGDSKMLIERFLETKGYRPTMGFINELRHYENKLKESKPINPTLF